MFKDKIRGLYKTYSNYKRANVYHERIKGIISNADDDVPDLTKSEVEEINTFWKPYGVKPCLDYYRWFYYISGIKDCRFIPEDVFALSFIPRFVNNNIAVALSDKNLYDLLFSGFIFPETIVHNSHGITLDSEYNKISRDELLKLISNEDYVVIKPTINSGKGKGVICVPVDEVESKLEEYKSDYIIQKKIVQHKFLSQFNESSVNVIRITTMLLNGEVIALSPALRVGDPGEFTDQGKNKNALNISIGIDEDGRLRNYGVGEHGEIFNKFPWGPEFASFDVPCFKEMIDTVKKAHLRTACAGLIGWDITIDAKGQVVIIECNMKWPGIVKYQLCNGPFFGNYTNDVLKYVFGE